MDPSSLQIVIYPDPILRRKAQRIESVTDQVRAVAQRMIELMHEARGVGLAGPQVGLSWRLFVTNPTGEPDADRVLLNPVLSDPSRQQAEAEEGCLSLPHVNAQIRRPVAITIDALDLSGNKVHCRLDQMPARIYQHETDHLDGTLIVDRMTPIDRMANRQAIRELEQAAKMNQRKQ